MQRKRKGRDQPFVTRDLMTALAVCHNVTPSYPNSDDRTIKEFQASSPDEIALVKFADNMGMRLIDRDSNKITIYNSANKLEEYEILVNFPFSSESKRMGIVVRHIQSAKLIFYLKGAEVVMKNKVKPIYRATIDEACDNLAM